MAITGTLFVIAIEKIKIIALSYRHADPIMPS